MSGTLPLKIPLRAVVARLFRVAGASVDVYACDLEEVAADAPIFTKSKGPYPPKYITFYGDDVIWIQLSDASEEGTVARITLNSINSIPFSGLGGQSILSACKPATKARSAITGTLTWKDEKGDLQYVPLIYSRSGLIPQRGPRFGEAVPSGHTVYDDLDRLSTIKDGWLDEEEDSRAPHPDLLQIIREMLKPAEADLVLMPRAFCTPKGGVELVWYGADYTLTITVEYPSGLTATSRLLDLKEEEVRERKGWWSPLDLAKFREWVVARVAQLREVSHDPVVSALSE